MLPGETQETSEQLSPQPRGMSQNQPTHNNAETTVTGTVPTEWGPGPGSGVSQLALG